MSGPAPHPTPTNNDTGAGTGRGAPGRVVEVHTQTRHGLLVAAAFVVAAVVSGIARVGTGWWLPLHLLVVGGPLSAISATTKMLDPEQWDEIELAHRAVEAIWDEPDELREAP